MPAVLKVLLSLVIEVVCATAGAILGAGIVMCCLRADESGPGAGVTIIFFGLIGFMIGSFLDAAGIVMFWRRVNSASQPFSASQTRPQAAGVWPPPPKH